MLQQTPPRILECPACRSAQPQRFLYTKNGCDILACEQCGIGRAEAPQFDPSSYYTEDYFTGEHADGYADYVGAEAVLRREFARTVDELRRFRPNGRLLEIGCAYGFFLLEAKRHFKVCGIELAEEPAAHGRRLGLSIISGVADAETLAPLGQFDAIVMLDVIEHLPDPRGTLALCAKHLNPGGVIMLTTGDFGSRSARLAGARWRLMTPPQHLWYFTKDSMRRLADGAGLRMASFDHPWKLVPLSLISFQLRRMFGIAPKNEPRPTRLGIPVNLFDAMRVVLQKP